MRKFIYSGCSFTGWHYPTWADIIAYDHITQGNVDVSYNFGRAGACNYYIQSSLFAAHNKLKITDNDYVGVGWSTPWRDSVFTTWDPFNKHHHDFPGWQTFGYVYSNPFWEQVDNHDIIHTNDAMFQKTLMAYDSVKSKFNINYEIRMQFSEGDSHTNGRKFGDGGYCNPSNNFFNSYHKNILPEYMLIPQWDLSTPNPNYMDIFFGGHPSMELHLEHAMKLTSLHPDTIKEVMLQHNKNMDKTKEIVKNYYDADTDTYNIPSDLVGTLRQRNPCDCWNSPGWSQIRTNLM
jgi:hypothetical protein